MDDALPFPIGSLVDGRYRIVAVLGQGGMGAVYRAEQVSLQREVALKVLRADLAGNDAAARFSREALALSKLDHPNIVRVIDSGQADGRPYLVMELVSGRDLLQELFTGPMAPEKAVPILAQLCDALSVAHERGIIHRDLKPENVILTEAGVPKILDFGIAIADGTSRVTAAGFVLGTPEYLAPEQAMGQPLTPRSDLYTLGVVAYRMLSGHLPFTAREPREYLLMHAGTPCPDIREKWPAGKDWPELCDAVMKALNKDPWLRYADALAMKQALEAALAHQQLAPGNATRRVTPVEQIKASRAATSALAVKTQNVAVLFAEVCGWAERTAGLPPHAASALQSRFEQLLAPIAKRHGGRKVKAVGGTLIFSIPSPTSAVSCAMAMQDRLWSERRDGTHDLLLARLSLSLGEVTVQEGDLFGEPVNIAARVLELTGEGEIAFTDAVYLAMNRSELLADELGPQTLKGIPYPVRVFKVRRGSVADLPPYGTPVATGKLFERVATAMSDGRAVAERLVEQASNKLGGRSRVFAAAGGAALLLLAAVALPWALHRPAQPAPVKDETLEKVERALAHKNVKEAQRLLAPMLAQSPAQPRALALGGRAAIAEGDWNTGLERLRDAARADANLRPELVNACMQGLGQVTAGRRPKCPVRKLAITLLVASHASEARSELTRIAGSSECGHDEAKDALLALGN